MATYDELRALFSENQLQNRIQVACIVAAETIRGEDAGTENHANRLVWARRAFENPEGISKQMLMALLAANKDGTVVAITLDAHFVRAPRDKDQWCDAVVYFTMFILEPFTAQRTQAHKQSGH